MRITELEVAGRAQPAGIEAHCHRVAQGIITPHRQNPWWFSLGCIKEFRFQAPVFVVSFFATGNLRLALLWAWACLLGAWLAVSSPGHPQPPHSPAYHSRMGFAVVCRNAKSPYSTTLVIKTTYPQLTLLQSQKTSWKDKPRKAFSVKIALHYKSTEDLWRKAMKFLSLKAALKSPASLQGNVSGVTGNL